MYDDYVLFSESNIPKNNKININRQLLIKNMGVQRIIFELIDENRYLI
jgi:hypothetical protein